MCVCVRDERDIRYLELGGKELMCEICLPLPHQAAVVNRKKIPSTPASIVIPLKNCFEYF